MPMVVYTEEELIEAANKAEAEGAARAAEDRDKALDRARRLGECLAFLASVIKSGEPWSQTCERMYREAVLDQST